MGSPAHVLIDLSTSLIDGLIQARKHEITIRKNNSIELEKDGRRNTVKLDGRGIEKIVVTLFDFGGFQDRLVVKHFLEAIVQVNFNCDSEQICLPEFRSKLMTGMGHSLLDFSQG